MDKLEFVIKQGSELTSSEIDAINAAKHREWQVPPMGDEQRLKHFFALLKDQEGNIQAQGELIPIDGITFDNEQFSVFGIGGIIAYQKGQGFGQKLMQGIIEYAQDQQKSLLGFTGNDIIGFYKKCGFIEDYSTLKRFVHIRDGEKITNTTEDVVFYLDSKDQFMQTVLANPTLEVFLPQAPDW